jgi:hypothetical protein
VYDPFLTRFSLNRTSPHIKRTDLNELLEI